MCLGQEDAADLRAPLRASESDELLEAAIEAAIARKPKGHDFIIDRRHTAPAVGAAHERDGRLSISLAGRAREANSQERHGPADRPIGRLPFSAGQPGPASVLGALRAR